MEFVSANNSFACEVREHDLWKPADPETQEAIRNAYRQHGVLVFRRQAMSEPDLLTFGKMYLKRLTSRKLSKIDIQSVMSL